MALTTGRASQQRDTVSISLDKRTAEINDLLNQCQTLTRELYNRVGIDYSEVPSTDEKLKPTISGMISLLENRLTRTQCQASEIRERLQFLLNQL